MNYINLILLSLKATWIHRNKNFFIVLLISVNLTLSISFERLIQSLEQSFSGAVSGIDLLVGAPTSPLNLVLYTLFQVGQITDHVPYEIYQKIMKRPEIERGFPISLGDSHRGFRVVGVDKDFFQYYQFRQKEFFQIKEGGRFFQQSGEVVIGFEVARKLNYVLNQTIFVSHGAGGAKDISFLEHDAYPMKIVGILKPTGTPWDVSVFVSINDLDRMHGYESTQFISAFFLKLKSKLSLLKIQKEINQHQNPSLLAVIPAMALSEFWEHLNFFSRILKLLQYLLLGISFLALEFIFQYIFASRSHEAHLLRILGVSRMGTILFFILEMLLMLVLSLILSYGLDILMFTHLSSLLLEHFNIWIDQRLWISKELFLNLIVICGLALIFYGTILFFHLRKFDAYDSRA